MEQRRYIMNVTIMIMEVLYMDIKKLTAGLLAVSMIFSNAPQFTQFVTAEETSNKYEAEDAEITADKDNSNYNKYDYIKSDDTASEGSYFYFTSKVKCTFTITVSESGLYDLTFRNKAFDYKENDCLVDGENVGKIVTPKSEGFINSTLKNISLSKGTHKITVSPNWGWISLDCLEVSKSEGISDDVYNVSKTLSNPNANETTQKTFAYICDNYGKKVISGQQCDNGLNGFEISRIKKLTGKTPAMIGFDFMNYSPSRQALGARGDSVDNALKFAEKGGLVTFCWHWNAPTKYLKSSSGDGWWGGFYTDKVKIDEMDLEKMISGEDAEGHKFLYNEIDAIAKQLKILEKKDVTVLFRPLHEASGGWFWWGAYGPKTYKKLWNLMYNRLTNYHKLNNIIWVWNGQDPEWYPGDKTVDVIGEDIYPGENIYNPQSSKFADVVNYTKTNKIISLTENGCLFDIDKAFENNTKWSWFCTWSGDFVRSEKYTEESMWKKVYNNSKTVTLSSLPDIRKYSIGKVNISGALVTVGSAVYNGKAVTPKITVNSGGKNLVKGKDYKLTFSDNNGFGTAKVTITGIGNYKGSMTRSFTIVPASSKAYLVSNSADSISLKWTKAPKADGYVLYSYKNGKWTKVKSLKTNRTTVKNLTSGKNYKFIVKAYKKSGSEIYYSNASNTISTCTKPAKTSLTSISSTASKTVKASWKKVSGASYYDVQITSDSKLKGGKHYIKSGNSAKISKLVSNRKYYVRVRACKKVNGKVYYGKWSSAKAVRAK